MNVTSFADKSMTKRARIERKVNAKKVFPVKINLWRTKRSDVPHMRVIVVYCMDYYGTGLLCTTEQDTEVPIAAAAARLYVSSPR